MKGVILQFNLPSIIVPIEQIKAINPYGESLLSIELTTGKKYLSYHISFN